MDTFFVLGRYDEGEVTLLGRCCPMLRGYEWYDGQPSRRLVASLRSAGVDTAVPAQLDESESHHNNHTLAKARWVR